MPYVPNGITSSQISDSPAGTVSTTIADAGAVYSQAGTNDFRSSILSRFNALRSRVITARATRGGGYRPISVPTALTLDTAASGSNVPNAGAAYLESNEETARANQADEFNKLRTDATFLTGPTPTALTALTDNSTGTPGTATGNPDIAHTQANANDWRATIAAKLNALETAIGA